MIVEKKSEIITHIKRLTHEIAEYTSALDAQSFVKSDSEKWSAGQIVNHLTKSAKPLVLALRLPRFVLGLMRKKKTALTYEEVVEKYKTVLEQGGKSSALYLPSKIGVGKKEEEIEEFVTTHKKLTDLLQFFDDKDLNEISFPHPLLGKLSAKELLFFTIYHLEHHFKTIKEITKNKP